MMQTRRSSRALNEDRERKEDTVVEEASPRTKTKKARRALVSCWKTKLDIEKDSIPKTLRL